MDRDAPEYRKRKYAIPAMIANGGGSIVNLSSIAGIIGSEHVHIANNASKAAVRSSRLFDPRERPFLDLQGQFHGDARQPDR